MYEILVKSGQSLDAADEFEKLILHCVKDNICHFDSKVFRFPDGFPMGGPFSSLMADVLMDRLERWVLNFARFSSLVLLWYRYVDDTFCIWNGTDSELETFTKDLHTFDP